MTLDVSLNSSFAQHPDLPHPQRNTLPEANIFIRFPLFPPPPSSPHHRLGENEVEVGLGIHGEPGVARMNMTTADKLVQHMLTIITESRHFGALKKVRHEA